MSESFLHYVWQFQYFNKQNLSTSHGDSIQVLHPGYVNRNAGPDFQQARVRIGTIEWAGAVEIHIQGSGWRAHQHDRDAAYNNVVLHVVWKDDKPAYRQDGTDIPTLSLGTRVEDSMLLRYRTLINTYGYIPCQASLPKIRQITWYAVLDRLSVTRLERKAQEVLDRLERNHQDWEETCYQLLARNFGFKLNNDPFEQLAQGLSYKMICAGDYSQEQLEALLLGQAGFLQPVRDDDYLQQQYQTYAVLAARHGLGEHQLLSAQWKFMRLRPANFPTIRLAQLAALLAIRKNLFSYLMVVEDLDTLRFIFRVRQSAYWQKHYLPGRKAEEEIPSLGGVSIDNIIINTVVPLLAAYGRLHKEDGYVNRAVALLEAIRPEENHIMARWAAAGAPCQSALDSQALLELHNNFCSKRRCLDCSIGFTLLNPTRRE